MSSQDLRDIFTSVPTCNAHNMRTLLNLLLIVLLALSQVPAMVLASSSPPPPKEEGHGGGESKDKGGEGGEVTGGRFAGDPIYVRIEPLVVPVISDDGLQQMVTMLVTIEVADFDAADFVHSHMPRVRDAIVRAIYGGLSSGDLRNGKMVNLNRAKARITDHLRKIMKPESVKDVLLQGVAQRMF